MRACYARRESLTGRVSGARFAGVTVHVVPRRQTLVTQTIAVLERGLREGRWTGTLPGQHTLCDQLVISRTTLRAALQVLARRNLIHLRQGTPTAIRRRPKTAHSAQRIDDVIVLLPERLWQLRPSVGRWVGELRPLLQRSGLELILSEDGLFYRPQPERRLEQLVQRHPHSGWVLFTSTLAMQSWFAARGLPVVRGSTFLRSNTITLPFPSTPPPSSFAPAIDALPSCSNTRALRRTPRLAPPSPAPCRPAPRHRWSSNIPASWRKSDRFSTASRDSRNDRPPSSSPNRMRFRRCLRSFRGWVCRSPGIFP